MKSNLATLHGHLAGNLGVLTIPGGLIPGPGTPGPVVPPGPAREPDDVRLRMSVCPDQASSGSGDAINSIGYNLSVSNGTIWGMPDDGIQTGSDAMIRNVRVLETGDNGITMQRGSIVTESIADDNEDVGFLMDAGTLVSNCTVHNNGTGIQASNSGQIRGCSIYSNDNWGIQGGSAYAYSYNNIRNNGTDARGSGRPIGANYCTSGYCPVH